MKDPATMFSLGETKEEVAESLSRYGLFILALNFITIIPFYLLYAFTGENFSEILSHIFNRGMSSSNHKTILFSPVITISIFFYFFIVGKMLKLNNSLLSNIYNRYGRNVFIYSFLFFCILLSFFFGKLAKYLASS